MTDYTPIDCGTHSEYELAILRGRPLRLSWCDRDGQSHIAVLTPVDMITREREEFLVLRDSTGRALELRLDFIRKMESL